MLLFQNVSDKIPENLQYTIMYAGQKRNQMFYFKDLYDHDWTKSKDFLYLSTIL